MTPTVDGQPPSAPPPSQPSSQSPLLSQSGAGPASQPPTLAQPQSVHEFVHWASSLNTFSYLKLTKKSFKVKYYKLTLWMRKLGFREIKTTIMSYSFLYFPVPSKDDVTQWK